MNTTLIIVIVILAVLLVISLIVAIMSFSKAQSNAEKLDSYFKSYGELLAGNQRIISEQQDLRLRALEDSMSRMRSDNSQQMEAMRKSVNDRLEAVYEGLGEMRQVASNVTDLKKILSNVKTRGILGEVQLGAILDQILNNEQYEENVAPIPGNGNRVEFAIKLPGDGDKPVYLPIDSKFPGDSYAALLDAYDSGDKLLIDAAKKRLFGMLASEAKDIRDKYIEPPHTTDFGIMFLPFEGLYAEAVNGGMIELLQRKYRVTIAGPTTMAALLNSLQMGFNTLAIEKKSSEVWKILSDVKTEFNTFGEVLDSVQHRLNQANADLDKLVGTRTRQIQRKLKDVVVLDYDDDGNRIDG